MSAPRRATRHFNPARHVVRARVTATELAALEAEAERRGVTLSTVLLAALPADLLSARMGEESTDV